MNWNRVLPVAAVEGLVLGYVVTAFSGAGYVPQYWVLLAVIVGVTVLIGAILVERIARQRVTGPTAAHLALIFGPLLGVAAAYLLQPVGGPT